MAAIQRPTWVNSSFKGCPLLRPKSIKQNRWISTNVTLLPVRYSLFANCPSRKAILSCAMALKPWDASGRQRIRSLNKSMPSPNLKPCPIGSQMFRSAQRSQRRVWERSSAVDPIRLGPGCVSSRYSQIAVISVRFPHYLIPKAGICPNALIFV